MKLVAGRGAGLGSRVAVKVWPWEVAQVSYSPSWGVSTRLAGPAPPLVPRNVPERGGLGWARAAEPLGDSTQVWGRGAWGSGGSGTRNIPKGT